MVKTFYHGRGEKGLRNIAEEGIIKGSKIDDDEIFPTMSPEMEVYGKENAVWVTDSRECAEVYAWGGGYLELDPSELKIVEDRNSCYAVIMNEEVSLDHVNKIMVEEREGSREEPQRNFDLEIANILDEKYNDIKIGTYKPKDITIE